MYTVSNIETDLHFIQLVLSHVRPDSEIASVLVQLMRKPCLHVGQSILIERITPASQVENVSKAICNQICFGTDTLFPMT